MWLIGVLLGIVVGVMSGWWMGRILFKRNKAIRYKIGDQWKWTWYDSVGRNYGPYDTKQQAITFGPRDSIIKSLKEGPHP